MHDGNPMYLEYGPLLGVGRLDGFTETGAPIVATPSGERFEARTLVRLGPEELGLPLAFGRLDGDGGTPLVLGIILRPTPLAVVDGEPVRIEASQRLELRCGLASVTLFADGRVEIRGKQILSRAEGANHVQGGSVHLN